VLPRVPVDLPLVDLSALGPDESEARASGWIREDSASPFDLVSGPLVRAAILKLEPERHRLVFTAHHIVCDGWSTNILLDELSQLYGAKRARSACLLPAPVQFRDYARSQEQWMKSPERAEVEAWWCGQFATPLPPLQLPTDRPRGAVKSYRGDTSRRMIGATRAQEIKRAGARLGCTLFATLLAGFKLLLHRLSDQSEIVVGIPAAGQSLLDDGLLVGHCVNFLPIRTSFAPGLLVRELLRRVKGTVLDANEHQNYTYGSLVRKLNLPRDPSRLPLVEVQFNLERVGTGLSFPGLTVEVDGNPKSFVNFDLFLNVVESESGLVLDCDYNSDLFDWQTVDRWLDHYETILGVMAADSDRPVAAVPLLSPTERHRLLVEWNATAREFPRDRCVHHLIEEQAARTPSAIAAVSNGQQLTYAELDARAGELAARLLRLGIGRETPVGLYLDRSLEMIVGALAILKAGGAYVPLDPHYPAARIGAILKSVEPPLVLTLSRTAPTLEQSGCRILCLDAPGDQTRGPADIGPVPPPSAENLAYVIFTSGSTGRPKGVEITHRSVVNFLAAMAKEPGLGSEARLLALTTLAFDIAGLEIWLPLSRGARVVLASREDAADGARLLELMVACGATVVQATPATWRLLLEAGWKGSPGLKVLCGGEALPRDLADELLPRASEVWNMYGPTETTIWSAASRVQPGTRPVPLGRPIANTEFYVLDPRGELVPVGVAGELYIGGAGLARGYWNDADLTAEKFVTDRCTGREGARLYRTGDLVRYLPGGDLEFLGRLDHQVKIRGFRIEAAEVELALGQHPAVRQSVVIAREDRPGDRRLVAYLAADEPAPSPSELRQFVASRLPDYMVPSSYIRLAELPRTPNG
jgi:amino acid adenylation domain-containing protein